MYHYRAYGLGVHSEIQLFDIPVQSVKPDVVISREAIDLKSVDRNAESPYLSLSPQHAIFSIDGVGRFQVSGGNNIIIDPDENTDQVLLQRYIIGACMALLLYQRNQLVLHASAIDINGQGVAFMGASGAGKSSMAAAFIAAGHKMLVDDVTSIDIRNDLPYTYSGFPYIKLVNGTLTHSLMGNKKLEHADHLEHKTGFRIVKDLSVDEVPLVCIFVIKPGEVIELRQYDYQQSLIELVRYSLPPSMVRLDKSAHFSRCLKVVNTIPVYELSRKTDLKKLNDLVVHVESFISAIKYPAIL